MKKATIQDKLLSAKCKELVKGSFDVFETITEELVDELSGTIIANTSDSIALEYMRREGMKQGIKEFLRRIHSKAAQKYE